MNLPKQLPTWLAGLNVPVPRSVVIVTLALGVGAIAITPALLNGGLDRSNIIFPIFCAIGGIGLGIEYTRPTPKGSTEECVGCCGVGKRYNRLLEAWFFVAGISAIFTLALILFAIFNR
jgi:hypothetical protein